MHKILITQEIFNSLTNGLYVNNFPSVIYVNGLSIPPGMGVAVLVGDIVYVVPDSLEF